MKNFLTFLAVGTFYSTVEEFLTVYILKRDVGAYVFTLVILFPVFLTIVYFSSWVLDRVSATEARRERVHFFVYGFAGLMIEWFLIGLSPWSNPQANPVLMLLFQLGMFAFWATVAFAPRLSISTHELARKTSRSIRRFYVPYFTFVYLVAAVVPPAARFAALIPLIIVGYFIVNANFILYFRRTSETIAGSPTDAESARERSLPNSRAEVNP